MLPNSQIAGRESSSELLALPNLGLLYHEGLSFTSCILELVLGHHVSVSADVHIQGQVLTRLVHSRWYQIKVFILLISIDFSDDENNTLNQSVL